MATFIFIRIIEPSAKKDAFLLNLANFWTVHNWDLRRSFFYCILKVEQTSLQQAWLKENLILNKKSMEIKKIFQSEKNGCIYFTDGRDRLYQAPLGQTDGIIDLENDAVEINEDMLSEDEQNELAEIAFQLTAENIKK